MSIYLPVGVELVQQTACHSTSHQGHAPSTVRVRPL